MSDTLTVSNINYRTISGSTITASTIMGSTLSISRITASTITVSTIFSATGQTALGNSIANPNRFVEVGSDVANSMYLDFHSSDAALPDYSTRIISQGGATTGTGGLNMYASTIGLVATNGVGIGTTVPSAALDVYYNGGASGTTQANITNFAGGSTTTNSSALNLRIQGAGGGLVDNYISAQYNSSGVGTYSLAFKPFGTTVMTVLGSGNVGIGVAAPESLLTLYGSNMGAIAPTLTGQWKAQHAIYATGAYSLKLGAHYTSGVGAYSSIQSTEYYSGTEHPGYMVLQPIGGNVGIGVTAPSAALHIKNAISAMRISGNLTDSSARPARSTTPGAYEIRGSGALDGFDAGFLRISAGGGTNTNQQSYIDLSASNSVADMDRNIVFGTAGVERMRIGDGGNVGIGMTNPTASLHVNGTLNIIGNSNGGLRIDASGTNPGFSFGGNGVFGIDAPNIGNGRFVVTNGGNVGIGKVSPGEKLDVSGGVKATSGFYSYNTSFYYYYANTTWSPGDPTNWPFGGNVFLVTFRGPSGKAGTAVRAAFIVFHSRWGAGNNNYGQITPLSNSYVSSWTITDGGISFTFNSPQEQEVAINFLVLN